MDRETMSLSIPNSQFYTAPLGTTSEHSYSMMSSDNSRDSAGSVSLLSTTSTVTVGSPISSPMNSLPVYELTEEVAYTVHCIKRSVHCIKDRPLTTCNINFDLSITAAPKETSPFGGGKGKAPLASTEHCNPDNGHQIVCDRCIIKRCEWWR